MFFKSLTFIEQYFIGAAALMYWVGFVMGRMSKKQKTVYLPQKEVHLEINPKR